MPFSYFGLEIGKLTSVSRIFFENQLDSFILIIWLGNFLMPFWCYENRVGKGSIVQTTFPFSTKAVIFP